MIGNFLGLLATLYLLLLFIAVFCGAMLYRFYVLPYLGTKGYPNKLAYRRATEYRQILRAEKLLKNESILLYWAVLLLRKFERVLLKNKYKVTFGWIGFFGLSLLCVMIGI